MNFTIIDSIYNFLIIVKVTYCRTGGVTGYVAVSQIADFFKNDFSVSIDAIAIPRGVFRIDQNIKSSITVPVNNGQFDSS